MEMCDKGCGNVCSRLTRAGLTGRAGLGWRWGGRRRREHSIKVSSLTERLPLGATSRRREPEPRQPDPVDSSVGGEDPALFWSIA